MSKMQETTDLPERLYLVLTKKWRLALLVALQTQKNQDVDLDPTRMTQLP